jgi:hypothetical protein
MVETQEKKLMLKFLTKNFPVYRLKHNMKFKRTIVLETGESYLLSDKNSVNDLYYKLSDILTTVFNSDNNVNKDVLESFLNIKKP